MGFFVLQIKKKFFVQDNCLWRTDFFGEIGEKWDCLKIIRIVKLIAILNRCIEIKLYKLTNNFEKYL